MVYLLVILRVGSQPGAAGELRLLSWRPPRLRLNSQSAGRRPRAAALRAAVGRAASVLSHVASRLPVGRAQPLLGVVEAFREGEREAAKRHRFTAWERRLHHSIGGNDKFTALLYRP